MRRDWLPERRAYRHTFSLLLFLHLGRICTWAPLPPVPPPILFPPVPSAFARHAAEIISADPAALPLAALRARPAGGDRRSRKGEKWNVARRRAAGVANEPPAPNESVAAAPEASPVSSRRREGDSTADSGPGYTYSSARANFYVDLCALPRLSAALALSLPTTTGRRRSTLIIDPAAAFPFLRWPSPFTFIQFNYCSPRFEFRVQLARPFYLLGYRWIQRFAPELLVPRIFRC